MVRLNYSDVRDGRRIFTPDINPIPTRQNPQGSLFEVNDFAAEYGDLLVNLIRKEVGNWRNESYPNTTRVTKELLDFWFKNPERSAIKKLFFAQREAVETAIWLNEVANKNNAGQNILEKIREGQVTVSEDKSEQLPRIAFKMATGTGKTVVMGCLILYHFFNRMEYRQDTRYADYFLIVAPGITIRDRLGVLLVDKKATDKNKREDYYALRDLIPGKLEPKIDVLNSKLIITNYHQFEPKTLQGNKRSPFDGKMDSQGKKTKGKRGL
jgi:type III restriction enzyme